MYPQFNKKSRKYDSDDSDSDDSDDDLDIIHIPDDPESQTVYHQHAAAVYAITAAPNKSEQQPCVVSCIQMPSACTSAWRS